MARFAIRYRSFDSLKSALLALAMLTAAVLLLANTQSAQAGTLVKQYEGVSGNANNWSLADDGTWYDSTFDYYVKVIQQTGTPGKHCASAGAFMGSIGPFNLADSTPGDANSCATGTTWSRSYCSWPGETLRMGSVYQGGTGYRTFKVQIFRKTAATDCMDYHPTSVAGYTFRGTNNLGSNGVLGAGSYILSSDGLSLLLMTPSGNLELYGPGFQLRWQARSHGNEARFQSDGNFVVYEGTGAYTWNSGSQGNTPGALTIQTDGNLVATSPSGTPFWNTGTQGGIPATTLKYFDFMGANTTLNANQYAISPDRRFTLHFQQDGNLVLYAPGGRPTWNSGTQGSGATRAVMQSDGNLVLYTASNTPVWYTNTQGNYNAKLAVQSDGNLVIINASGTPVWYTNTQGKL